MHMWRNDKQMCGRLLQNTMDLVRQGVLREVKPIKVYSYSAIETALRHMQSGRHYGKMVFKVNDNDVVPVIPREPHELKLSPDATYVLIGGTGQTFPDDPGSPHHADYCLQVALVGVLPNFCLTMGLGTSLCSLDQVTRLKPRALQYRNCVMAVKVAQTSKLSLAILPLRQL